MNENKKEIRNAETNRDDRIEDVSKVFKELFMTDELLDLEKEIRREFPEYDPDHVMTPEEEKRFRREVLETFD